MTKNESKIKKLADAIRETTEAAEKLSEAIDKAVRETIVEVDGTAYTLPDAIRAYRGGNYLATKWKKTAEKQPKDGERVLVYHADFITIAKWSAEKHAEGWQYAAQAVGYAERLYSPRFFPYWMKLPLPPTPEKGVDE